MKVDPPHQILEEIMVVAVVPVPAELEAEEEDTLAYLKDQCLKVMP